MRALVAGLAVVLLVAVRAEAADPIAAITEIHARGGAVEVRGADEASWLPAKPLQSLRSGDQVRASGNGHAVLLLTGGRGIATVTPSNSPLTVSVQPADRLADRARTVIGGVTNFLLGQQREHTYQALNARGMRASAPVIVAPRNTRVASDAVVFEWLGSTQLRYRVRVVGAQGVVWEQAALPCAPLAYPASAPPLTPGTTYVWELETKEHGTQAARFEVAAPDAVRAVRAAIGVLGPSAGVAFPPATLALMRAGVLTEQQFYAEARRELADAIAASPDEATLHVVLAQVYEAIGLKDLADRSMSDAEALAGL